MKTLVLMMLGGGIAWVAFKHHERKSRAKRQNRPYGVPRGINIYNPQPIPAGFGAAAIHAAGVSPDAVDFGTYIPAYAPALSGQPNV